MVLHKILEEFRQTIWILSSYVSELIVVNNEIHIILKS